MDALSAPFASAAPNGTCIHGNIAPGPDWASALILITACIGVVFALFLLRQVAKVPLDVDVASQIQETQFLRTVQQPISTDVEHIREQNSKLRELYDAISAGANSFLFAEYRLCALFILLAFPFTMFVIAWGSRNDASAGGAWGWKEGAMSATSFAVGALTSIVCGFAGMRVAVFSNARCTVGACHPTTGWTRAFNTAFRAGGVMGFSLTGIALLSLYLLLSVLRRAFSADEAGLRALMDAVAGFGFGGSSIAMFGRVGGGIYTKAADVGADLAGKVVQDLPEDDPHNPGTIADNVGDNVGDVAGMGSDLFGSFGEASCAALLVGASSPMIVAAGGRRAPPLRTAQHGEDF